MSTPDHEPDAVPSQPGAVPPEPVSDHTTHIPILDADTEEMSAVRRLGGREPAGRQRDAAGAARPRRRCAVPARQRRRSRWDVIPTATSSSTTSASRAATRTFTRTRRRLRRHRPRQPQRHLRQPRPHRRRGHPVRRRRGADRQVPPDLLRRCAEGQRVTAAAARAVAARHRQGARRAAAGVPRPDDHQDPLPRVRGPARARAHAVGLPQVLLQRRRAAALHPAPAARQVLAAGPHPPGPRRHGSRRRARHRAGQRPRASRT